MDAKPNIATAAFLIADPARAAMLMALLDGRALPAGELAFAAGVSPQTASSHLGKLLAGGLLAVETEGRHRYYRLAGAHIASALESLASIGATDTVRRRPVSSEAQRLQFARCCYDHLAGRVGVAVTHGLIHRGFIAAQAEKRYAVTPTGRVWFEKIGLDVSSLRRSRNGLARQCLDWTEREHHLAGPLGVQLLNALCTQGWFARKPASRAVQVTSKGWAELKAHFSIEMDALAPTN